MNMVVIIHLFFRVFSKRFLDTRHNPVRVVARTSPSHYSADPAVLRPSQLPFHKSTRSRKGARLESFFNAPCLASRRWAHAPGMYVLPRGREVLSRRRH